ncbi:hypothetical protein QUF72_09120 [Desulfobacterales bacterium HSG2]|nr:hypothetical protein [Desulfobacterales bacterium HSG2]
MGKKAYQTRFTHLATLKKILKEKNKKCLFPCIGDLVRRGVVLKRFSDEDDIPGRQEATRYIAGWFKYVGVSEEVCLEWMTEYSLDVLSAISSSSKSQIRHSTKSNIRYIYRADLPFDCGCMNNPFKASCRRTCPIYKEMLDKYEERMAREANRDYDIEIEDGREYDESKIEKTTIKDQYSEQFEEAWELAEKLIEEGVPRKKIINILNERGLRTRTGRKWTYAILGVELKNLPYQIETGTRTKPQIISVKELYKEQFERGRKFALNLIRQNIPRQEVVRRLNEKEFKTRTGKKWTTPILRAELKQLKSKDEKRKGKKRKGR